MREIVKSNLSVESKEGNPLGVLKQNWYFGSSVGALILSACFPVVEKQLLVLSIITGAKWIVSGKSEKINIFIKSKGGI